MGAAPPRAARPRRLRGLARRARLADERRPPAGRRVRGLGVGLPRLEPGELDHRRPRRRPHRLGRRTTRTRGGISDRALRRHHHRQRARAAARSPTRSPPSGKRILLLERGNFLPREMENWDPRPVFIDGRYISEDTWYDADGKPFQPQVHYFVGGATKLYGAALYRLRPQDFGELQHVDGLSPAWPLTYDDFEPYYTKAEWLYQVHGNARRGPHRGPLEQAVPVARGLARAAHPAALRRPARRRLPPVPRALRHPARRGRPARRAPASAARGATATRAWCTPRPTPRRSPSARCSTSRT